MGTRSRTKQTKGQRPKWLQPLDDPREEAILSAAFDVFCEKGFHGATMLDVASRAQASKETLYERFKSKAGLFEALVAWGCRQNLPDMAWLERSRAEPKAALKAYARLLLKAIMRPEAIALYRITVAEGERLPQAGRILSQLTRDPSIAIVVRLALDLHARGDCSIDDADAFADHFIGLLRGDAYHQALSGLAPPPSERQIEAIADRAMHRLLKAYAP
jgi:AcrR family transcriptional regulator